MRTNYSLAGLILVTVALTGRPALGQSADDDAAAFGKQETAYSAELSADGKKMVFVGPSDGMSTIAVMIDLQTGSLKQIARSDGNPLSLHHCGFTAADRLICSMYGLERVKSVLLNENRKIAIDADGENFMPLNERNSLDQLYIRSSDGQIVDWMNGVDGNVLVSRWTIPEMSTGKLTARTLEGFGVVKLDTRTGKATQVERPANDASEYFSDGQGNIRVMTTSLRNEDTQILRGEDHYFYRTKTARDWHELGIYKYEGDGRGSGIQVVTVDPNVDAAYVLKVLDGRWALYRISLDGSMKAELAFAAPGVDVDGVETVGRSGRVIGATYTTDVSRIEYFDPAYKSIAVSLAKALPKSPLISFVSASADEQVLLIRASGDIAPGRWYIYDRGKKTLAEAILDHPALKNKTLSVVKAISYPAGDGTMIPAYLTLPPGVTDAKGLPAIVMPHGGPAARDSWGFDWLSQFFAQRGYIVIQPNYRGSTGYGDDWYEKNGFQSWKTSIGDVCDAGRWLVKQGMADGSKLAIVGWSYGGYAALQANVLDPDLFKAVVAVAPVTDLALLKSRAMTYTSSGLVRDFIGSGPHVVQGSPAQNAKVFKAPVLMFQGDKDLNVDMSHAKKMDRELRSAGKSSELIMYPKLDHGLRDSTVRADLLRKSDAFLRAQLKMAAQ
jgi:dipeptidyl aminopeptidase/acylaminoacyl peptidase